MLKLLIALLLAALLCVNLWLYRVHQVGERKLQYQLEVSEWRQQKLNHLLNTKDSPLRDMELFGGLRFYPIKEQYRIQAKYLPRADTAQIVRTNRRSKIRLTWVGTLHFKANQVPCSLRAYRVPWDSAAHPWLLVPFRDSTNGRGSSVFGRYLDVKVEPDSTAWLDFNLAYNAYSLYNPWYISPKAPRANFLPVWVEVGERTYRMPDEPQENKRRKSKK